MQEDSRRLIDEAISFEPIKNTFRLSWEFVILNKKFTLTAMSMLLLLNLLTMFLGLLAMFASGILSMAIQIYISRLIYQTENIETFIAESKESKLETIVSKYSFTAMGAYFGTITLLLIFLALLTLLIQNLGVDLENIKLEELVVRLQPFALPMVLFTLAISYIYPLVESNIALSRDFKEAYRAVLTLFSPTLWRKTFHREYFRYISLLLLMVGAGMLFFGVLITIPVINIFSGFIIVIVMYLYMVLMSVTSMMARRVVE